MLTTILALALHTPAEAADHDAAMAAEALAMGPAVREADGHARNGSRPSARPSGARPSAPRPSAGRPSGARPSAAPAGSRPSPSGGRPTPAKPSGSSGPRPAATPNARPAQPRPGAQPSGAQPRPGATSAPASRPSPAARPGASAPLRNSATPPAARPGVTPRAGTAVVPGRSVTRPSPAAATRPTGTLRDATTSRPSTRPIYRSTDVRYARPAHYAVRPYPHARYVVPRVYSYRPYYSRWWCHPYYRYTYATVAVVGFGYNVYAWNAGWIPPHRFGWTWTPGYWAWGYWHPGFWVPAYRAPIGYVYVNGWWEGDAYVEGYYRKEARSGWEWVDGYYLDDGTYMRGHWMPTEPGPEGYVWEAGFWDGDTQVDGFWRPQFRQGYYWVAAWYDTDGVFHSGYWQPEVDKPGQVWVPGWFDGNEWNEGYWEDERTYRDADLSAWQPEAGVDDGWEEGQILDEEGYVVEPEPDAPPSAHIVELRRQRDGAEPLAVPVVIPEE